MSAVITAAEAADLLYREGHFLDARRWDDWLALYCEDAVFWVPAWKGAHELVDSPDTEVSRDVIDAGSIGQKVKQGYGDTIGPARPNVFRNGAVQASR